MIYNNPQTEDGTDAESFEDISELQCDALGEGAAMCQVCGCELREGDGVSAYAFRAAGNPFFKVGYVMCGADEHAHPTVFSRGVHELVVTGRIGVCADVAMQSSWLVLIAPVPVVVSRPSESVAHTIDEGTTRGPRTSTNPDRDTLRNRSSRPFQRLHELPPDRVRDVLGSGGCSQVDGTCVTGHGVVLDERATEQGGDE